MNSQAEKRFSDRIAHYIRKRCFYKYITITHAEWGVDTNVRVVPPEQEIIIQVSIKTIKASCGTVHLF